MTDPDAKLMEGNKEDNQSVATTQSRQSQCLSTSSSLSACQPLNTLAASSALTKIKWHIPTPKQVGHIPEALNRHNAVSTLDFDNRKPVSSTSQVSTASPSPAVASTISTVCAPSTKVAASVMSTSTCSTMSGAAKIGASYGYSSSSSSDSSDDSSSDDGQPTARNSGKLVINLDGGSLPKQLMMRCRVRLTHLTYATIVKLVSSQSIEEYLCDHSGSFTNYPLTTNTVKESHARPCSKRRLNVFFSKPANKHHNSNLIMGTLQRYRNCRVLLSDCWKGKPLPSYLNTFTDTSHEEELDSKSKKSKKKKKKMTKVKVEVDDESSKLSQVKSRRSKPKEERKRIIMEDSSDEDEVLFPSPRKGLKRSSEERNLNRHSRHDKVKELADKKGKSNIDVPKEESKSKSISSVYPWTEAIMTAGLPKIPKIKKATAGGYVPPSPQQMDSNFRQVENPYQRLQKREARRREFEKMAAMKYGVQSSQDSAGVPTSVDGTSHPVSTSLNSSVESHNAQVAQVVQAPSNVHPSHNQFSHGNSQVSHGVNPSVSIHSRHGHQPNLTTQVAPSESIAHTNVHNNKLTSQEPEQLSSSMSSVASQVHPPNAQLHSGYPPTKLGQNTQTLGIDTSLSTQNYQIPEPPIPKQAHDMCQADVATRAPLLPEPPIDPRALLPHPNMPGHMPSPVIPLSKAGNALLAAPTSTISNVVKMSPDCSSTEADVNAGRLRHRYNSPAVAPALLPEPDSLLPSPGGLLPVPNSLLPDPPDTFNSLIQRNSFNSAHEDGEWQSVRNIRLHNEMDTTKNEDIVSEWNRSQTESSHNQRESEASHQTMAADSTSNDDLPVNQQVMDEICRLSLEISKRIARKSAHQDDTDPPIIPLEPNEHTESQSQEPAEIPFSLDESDMICYDYGHTRPPLPKEDGSLPTAPVPRGPTPPPALAPPPSLPKSLQSSRIKPLLDHQADAYEEHYEPAQEYDEDHECNEDQADADHHPISSRHFEEPQHAEESYDDILAIEQERTRRELYYEDLRRSAKSGKRDRYQRGSNEDSYSSRGSQDYDSHQYEKRRANVRSELGTSRVYESDIDYSERFESTHYNSGYGESISQSSYEANTSHHYDSRRDSNRHYESQTFTSWDSHKQELPYERGASAYQRSNYQDDIRYTDDNLEDPYYTDDRNQSHRIHPGFQRSDVITKDRYGPPVVNSDDEQKSGRSIQKASSSDVIPGTEILSRGQVEEVAPFTLSEESIQKSGLNADTTPKYVVSSSPQSSDTDLGEVPMDLDDSGEELQPAGKRVPKTAVTVSSRTNSTGASYHEHNNLISTPFTGNTKKICAEVSSNISSGLLEVSPSGPIAISVSDCNMFSSDSSSTLTTTAPLPSTVNLSFPNTRRDHVSTLSMPPMPPMSVFSKLDEDLSSITTHHAEPHSCANPNSPITGTYKEQLPMDAISSTSSGCALVPVTAASPQNAATSKLDLLTQSPLSKRSSLPSSISPVICHKPISNHVSQGDMLLASPVKKNSELYAIENHSLSTPCSSTNISCHTTLCSDTTGINVLSSSDKKFISRSTSLQSISFKRPISSPTSNNSAVVVQPKTTPPVGIASVFRSTNASVSSLGPTSSSVTLASLPNNSTTSITSKAALTNAIVDKKQQPSDRVFKQITGTPNRINPFCSGSTNEKPDNVKKNVQGCPHSETESHQITNKFDHQRPGAVSSLVKKVQTVVSDAHDSSAPEIPNTEGLVFTSSHKKLPIISNSLLAVSRSDCKKGSGLQKSLMIKVQQDLNSSGKADSQYRTSPSSRLASPLAAKCLKSTANHLAEAFTDIEHVSTEDLQAHLLHLQRLVAKPSDSLVGISEKGTKNAPKTSILEMSSQAVGLLRQETKKGASSAEARERSPSKQELTKDFKAQKHDEHETASFFSNIASGSHGCNINDEDELVIPGLNVVKESMDAKKWEKLLGVPKYKYPLSIPELNTELAHQIQVILDNTSSAAVLKAFVRISILQHTDKLTFNILKSRNPELTDLSSIYNKVLINLMLHEDTFRLVTAAGISNWLPELEIHPMVRGQLLNVLEEMTSQ
ncbi:serine-rich adhesin for platelets-like [Watersipora subatra]|uniref:serine-rich adhesin for platelets-like n=1 Tax=Watersipora subatra TaxID=2589382 RepID=UPI00355B941D